MPVYAFATLILTVIALAGVSIALIWLAGINLVWLSLAAALGALAVRWAKR